MIAALLLMTYAVVAGAAGARLLRGGWSTRSPQWAVLGWQALSTSVLLAVLLAAVSLAVPFLPLRGPVAALIGAHEVTVVQHYETPLGPWPGLASLALVLGCAALLAASAAGDLARTRAVRRMQREALRLVATSHPEGFWVVEHRTPLAYCLPGGDRAVVLSSAALGLLTDRERELVLAHEHRHLRARHDLALAWSGALARTFPRTALFAEAHRRTAVLLEMAADDAAAVRPEDRRVLARALVALGTGMRPEATLAASDTAAVERVRRLVASPRPPRRGTGALAAAVAATAVVVPLVLALAPALEAAARECCAVPALTLGQSRVDQ